MMKRSVSSIFYGWCAASVLLGRVGLAFQSLKVTTGSFPLLLDTQSQQPLRQSQQFVQTPSRTRHSQSIFISSSLSATQLYAKKRRRRRQETDSPTATTRSEETDVFDSTSPEDSNSVTDDLPDFDLTDDPDVPAAAESTSSSSTKSQSPSTSTGSPSYSAANLEEITPAMMGSGSNGPARSVEELISDRALEQRFQFDEEDVDDDIPDFIQLAAQSSSSSSSSSSDPSAMVGGASTMGKKKQRQAERRANAIRAREESEEEANSGLLNIPFFSPEKDQVSGLKILENGGTR
jgi:hypothetical protein